MIELVPVKFINEVISVEFDNPPLYGKTPFAPDRFLWNEEIWHIKEVMLEWKDYERRGKASHNMRPTNFIKAMARGSFGVGRFYFRVNTQQDRIFLLYFDRAAEKDQAWILHAEYSYRLKRRHMERKFR